MRINSVCYYHRGMDLDLNTYLEAEGAMTMQDLVAAGVAKRTAQIYQWKVRRDGRMPSPETCAVMERVTSEHARVTGVKARMTCEALRPDVAWRRIPDRSWPWHPKGKPFVDVTVTS